jgi:hypothetical protein
VTAVSTVPPPLLDFPSGSGEGPPVRPLLVLESPVSAGGVSDVVLLALGSAAGGTSLSASLPPASHPSVGVNYTGVSSESRLSLMSCEGYIYRLVIGRQLDRLCAQP